VNANFACSVCGFVIPQQPVSSEPLFDFCIGLLYERPHWQAINETARPSFAMRSIRLDNTIPKPCEHHGGGFAETGWDVDQ
jgi:hypothetical protein